jgi:tRNA (guanine-N7-)-methyltransferase
VIHFAPFAPAPCVEWREIFDDERAVEIEIGCGKGAFLAALAAAHPQTNFFGIEVQARWVRLLEQRLAKHSLRNVRVLAADAALVLGSFVRDQSVRAHHLYFPDPWWKRRHEKRRLVQSDFAAALHRTLEPGGRLHLATDVGPRFEAMLEELGRLPFTITIDADRGERPPTNFERKYEAEGRKLYYATLVKPHLR